MKRETIEMNLLNAGCDAKAIRIDTLACYTVVYAKITFCLNICTDDIKRETGALSVTLSFADGELNLSLIFKEETE